MSRLFTILLICLSGVIAGCGYPRLRVQTLNMRPHDLASYRVGTPDPRHICPDVGQKLVIKWALNSDPKRCREPMLHLTIRYGNGEEEKTCHRLGSNHGTMQYPVLNAKYFEKGGIQACKVEIFVRNHCVASWRHQLWEDRLAI